MSEKYSFNTLLFIAWGGLNILFQIKNKHLIPMQKSKANQMVPFILPENWVLASKKCIKVKNECFSLGFTVSQGRTICLMSMRKAAWVGCQPQPWHNDRTLKSDPSSVGITIWDYCHIPMYSISMCSNTLYMSNMDVGSSLRWLSASTMTLCNHFDSTSDPEPQNLSQVVWV